MEYPLFESHILITTAEATLKLFLEKVFLKKIDSKTLDIKILKIENDKNFRKGSWVNVSSILELYLSDNFINLYPQNAEALSEGLRLLFTPLSKIQIRSAFDEHYDKNPPFPILSVFYRNNDGDIFFFVFDLEGDEENYIVAFNDLVNTIKSYNEQNNIEFNESIKNTYSQRDRLKYLVYRDNKWTVRNPLLEATNEINNKYRENKDLRISKPIILMHRNNYRKYFVFDNNWVLHFDKLETLMLRPNDVALYSNISTSNLNLAQKFYKNTILPRLKEYGGAFPSLKKQEEYYNYFELIISSLIFAYTSLEAFANICIPTRYEYIDIDEKNGIKTIYSKEAIEKRFSLRDKFKMILKKILDTPDVTQEGWWGMFISLEDLRNEIIHTKQSKSEDRYSRFLSKSIFKIIDVHKKIISYYGFYISKQTRIHKKLLADFPYNFGFDDIFPHLASEEAYQRSYNNLNNPYKNEKTKKMYKIGILAYGSLIDNPGAEIAKIETNRILCETPFNVEFARVSSTRDNAPTLIPVEENGNKVKAVIIILSDETNLEDAKSILWRREVNKISSTEKYSHSDNPETNKVTVKVLNNFMNVESVLYTSIGSNITQPITAALLADYSIASILSLAGQDKKDGLRYLLAAKQNEIVTPLSNEYEKQILVKTETYSLLQAIEKLDNQRIL